MCITLGEIDTMVGKSLFWPSVLLKYEFHYRDFSNKNITDNRKFREKRSKTYAEALQNVGPSNYGGEILEQLKAPNVLKEENHDFNCRYRFKKYIC